MAASGESLQSLMRARLRSLINDPRLPVWLFVGASVVAAVVLMRLHRGIFYFADDWNFLLERNGTFISRLFEDHNGHLVVFPYVTFKTIVTLFGAGTMWPFQLLSTVLHLLVAVLLFAWVRQRVDDWVALFAGVVVLFLGSGWEMIFWSFQMTMLGSIAAGLGALIIYERPDSRGNRIKCALLLGVSLACSGLGVLFVIGLGVRLLWRADRRRTLSIIAAPATLFAVWYLAFATDYRADTALMSAPAFAVELANYAGSGLMGLDPTWGRVIAAFAIFGLFKVIVRDNGIRPELLTVLAVLLSFWLLTSLQRSGTGMAWPSRYTYLGVVLIITIGAVALKDVKLNRGAHIAIAGLVAFSFVLNLIAMRNGAGTLRGYTQTTKAELTAFRLADTTGSATPQVDQFDPALGPEQLAPLLEIARQNPDRFTWRDGQIAAQSDQLRHSLDQTLLKIVPPVVEAVGPPAAGETVELNVAGGAKTAVRHGRCLSLPGGRPFQMDVGLNRESLYVSTSGTVELRARKYSSSFTQEPTVIVSDGGKSFRFPRDGRSQRWIVRLNGSDGALVCATL